jgi:type I restriction enzyme M protein
MTIDELETWLWDAACAIRGPVDAPKFKDYILPLVFLKRLSDVFEDELERLSAEYGKSELALNLLEQERESGRCIWCAFTSPKTPAGRRSASTG